MENTRIVWDGRVHVVGFIYDGGRLVVTVKPPDPALRALLVERIQAGTLAFDKGRECPELR